MTPLYREKCQTALKFAQFDDVLEYRLYLFLNLNITFLSFEEHVKKKLAFLTEHSTKALTTPPPLYWLAEQRNYTFFLLLFFYGHMYVLKPVNSDTEN